MTTSDILNTAQPFFAGRLAALDYFSDILVAAPRIWRDGEKLHAPKTILESVDNVLSGIKTTGGRCGAAVRVFQPALTMPKPNGREARLVLNCRIEVNPVLNFGPRGTHKPAQAIAYEVLRHGTGFTLLNGFCTLYAEGDCFLPYLNEELGYETVDVALQANCVVTPPNAVAMPTITVGANGLVTLATVTAGAAIYYVIAPKSQQGSPRFTTVFPSPRQAGASQYSGPFTMNSGDDLVCAAYLPGMAGSNVNFQTVNY